MHRIIEEEIYYIDIVIQTHNLNIYVKLKINLLLFKIYKRTSNIHTIKIIRINITS